jgi:hypothetical protein
MRDAGLGKQIEELRPYRELWIRARWRLGAMLAKMIRAAGPGRGKKEGHDVPSFKAELARLNLERKTADRAQRLAAFPEPELLNALKRAEDLPELDEMIRLAKPYWSKEQRKRKHKKIRAKAAEAEEELGPFPLIYADPPWKWGHFGERDAENEKGKSRTPDQHYETLTHDDVLAFKVQGKLVRNIAHKDRA